MGHALAQGMCVQHDADEDDGDGVGSNGDVSDKNGGIGVAFQEDQKSQ